MCPGRLLPVCCVRGLFAPAWHQHPWGGLPALFSLWAMYTYGASTKRWPADAAPISITDNQPGRKVTSPISTSHPVKGEAICKIPKLRKFYMVRNHRTRQLDLILVKCNLEIFWWRHCDTTESPILCWIFVFEMPRLNRWWKQKHTHSDFANCGTVYL